MSLALYIGAACIAVVGGIAATVLGAESQDQFQSKAICYISLAVWLICTIGAAAMLIAGVKA